MIADLLCNAALLSLRNPACCSTLQPDLYDFFFHLQALKIFLVLSVNLKSEVGAVCASSWESCAPAQANLQLPAGSQPNPLMSPQPSTPAPPVPGSVQAALFFKS